MFSSFVIELTKRFTNDGLRTRLENASVPFMDDARLVVRCIGLDLIAVAVVSRGEAPSG